MTKTILAIACLLIVTIAVHLVHEQLSTGEIINIKGRNGKYLSSDGHDFNNSGKGKFQFSAALVQAKDWRPPTKWVVEQYGDKYAFKNFQTNTYLARCNKCWKAVQKSNYDNSAFAHVQNPSEASSLWTVAKLSNGKYTIKGDNGKYLSVCYYCVKNGRWPVYAFVEVENPEDPSLRGFAQWEIKTAPQQ